MHLTKFPTSWNPKVHYSAHNGLPIDPMYLKYFHPISLSLLLTLCLSLGPGLPAKRYLDCKYPHHNSVSSSDRFTPTIFRPQFLTPHRTACRPLVSPAAVPTLHLTLTSLSQLSRVVSGSGVSAFRVLPIQSSHTKRRSARYRQYASWGFLPKPSASPFCKILLACSSQCFTLERTRTSNFSISCNCSSKRVSIYQISPPSAYLIWYISSCC